MQMGIKEAFDKVVDETTDTLDNVKDADGNSNRCLGIGG
jgi:hypothetical protein